jgi:hypothetical protein
VDVAQRCHQVLVTSELLDGLGRRAAHRQVRTERVTQDVVGSSCDGQLGTTLGGRDPRAKDLRRDRLGFGRVQHALTPKMPVSARRAAVNASVIGMMRPWPLLGASAMPAHTACSMTSCCLRKSTSHQRRPIISRGGRP